MPGERPVYGERSGPAEDRSFLRETRLRVSPDAAWSPRSSCGDLPPARATLRRVSTLAAWSPLASCGAVPPALATLRRVSTLAAWSPRLACGATPPILATRLRVSSSADARPRLDPFFSPVIPPTSPATPVRHRDIAGSLFCLHSLSVLPYLSPLWHRAPYNYNYKNITIIITNPGPAADPLLQPGGRLPAGTVRGPAYEKASTEKKDGSTGAPGRRAHHPVHPSSGPGGGASGVAGMSGSFLYRDEEPPPVQAVRFAGRGGTFRGPVRDMSSYPALHLPDHPPHLAELYLRRGEDTEMFVPIGSDDDVSAAVEDRHLHECPV